MAENLVVGQTAVYGVTWFDGPNGTGSVVPDPGTGTFVSDTPADMTVAPGTAAQTANVTAVAAGSVNLTATSSTGVVAGFLDSTGAYQSGPLAFLITAAAKIVSGVLKRIS